MAITAATQAVSWLLGSTILAAATPAAAQQVAAEPAAARVAAGPAAAGAAIAAAPATLLNRAQVEQAGLSLYWQRRVELLKGERLLRVAHLDENLYLVTSEGRVLTFDAATGVFRWAVTVAEPDIRLLGPTHGPDVVYFTSVLGTTAYDRVNGERRLKWRSDVTPASPVVSDGQSLYFGTVEGRVLNVVLSDLLMKWQFATDGLVTAAPVVLGPNLYVVSQAGRIYALVKANKVRIWESETTGPVTSNPAVYGSRLFVSSRDQSMWCFDVVTGRTLWRTRLATPLTESPKATAKYVYLPVPGHGLYCFSPDNGNINWNREEAIGFVAEHENLVWLISQQSALIGCDKASGEVRREIDCGANLWVSNEDDDAIWVAGSDGQVACIRPKGAGFLRYRSAREAAGRTSIPTTQPTTQSSDQDFVPNPKPRPPVDYLRGSETIPPVGGNAPTTQPDGGQ